jgi:hypothetical protein
MEEGSRVTRMRREKREQEKKWKNKIKNAPPFLFIPDLKATWTIDDGWYHFAHLIAKYKGTTNCIHGQKTQETALLKVGGKQSQTRE